MKTLLNSIFSCVLLWLISVTLQAQSTDTLWTRTLGGLSYEDELLHVIETRDGNFVAAGNIAIENAGVDVWLVKFNASGTILWNKHYCTDTTQPAGLWDGITGIVEKENGDLLAFAGNSQYAHYILTIGPDGELKTALCYKDSNQPYHVYCVAPTHDHNFIIAGECAIWTGEMWQSRSWVRKMDEMGNTIWEHSYPCIRWLDRFNCITALPDNGFLLAGTSDTKDWNDQLLIHRISSEGDTLWTRRLGTNVFDYPYEIAPLPDGGFILVFHFTYLSYWDGVMVKLDAEGNEIWRKEYNSYVDDRLCSVKTTSDGGLITTGRYRTSSEAEFNIWVMKTDIEGNSYAAFTIGGGRGEGRDIIQLSDGSYIGVGEIGDGGIIYKVNPAFGLFGFPENAHTEMELWPNPARDNFRIKNSGTVTSRAVIELADISGHVIKRMENAVIDQAGFTVDVQAVPPGVYLVKITGSSIPVVKKLIKH